MIAAVGAALGFVLGALSLALFAIDHDPVMLVYVAINWCFTMPVCLLYIR